MKAFCLAFAFLLASLPANADELPQTSNALRATGPELAEPGSFQWTVIDDAARGAQAPTAATEGQFDDKSAPARAALAQIRAETARIMDAARETSTKVSRIRYDLHLRCIVEQVDSEPPVPAEVALPYIWGSSEEKEPTTNTIEMCEIDYSQKVRAQPLETVEPRPQPREYNISLPVE